jgi:hypothetical protein
VLRIAGFLDFVQHPEFQILEKNVFETDPVSEMLSFLVFRIPDKSQVKKPSNSECHTPLSEPCGF